MPEPVNIIRGALLLACLITGVLAVSTWDSSYIGNDGVQYLSTASNWLNGKGFSTNALIYTPHFQGQIPAAQTVWPPGYPVAIAISTLSGLDLQQSALALNLLGHALASFLVFLILRNLTVTPGFSLTSACLFYLTAIPWHYTRGLVTEPIFTVLTLAIVLLLSMPAKKQSFRYLLCGLLAAVAVYTRYSAILFAFSVGLVVLIVTLFERGRSPGSIISSLLKLMLISLPPALAWMQLMFRNQQLTGNLQRETGYDSPNTLMATLKLWIGHTADVLGFSAGGLYNHTIGLVLYAVFFLVITTFSLYAIKSIVRGPTRLPLSATIPLSIIVTHSLTFVAYLSYCELSNSPLNITTRYIYQIYPGLFILFGFLIWTGISTAKTSKQASAQFPFHAAMVTLVSVFLIAQINETTAPPRFALKGKFVHAAMALPVTETMDLHSFIERCYTASAGSKQASATLWSTHGQQMHLNTNVPTLTRTEVYANNTLDFKALAEQIVQYNIRLFIFFDVTEDLDKAHVAAMRSIMDWLPQNGHSPITMKNNLTPYDISVQIYTVDGQCREQL